MASLFGKTPAMPVPPKPTRMPVETDPDILAAGRRTRQAALMRKGRLSTIMTDMTRSTTGADAYSRKTLG